MRPNPDIFPFSEKMPALAELQWQQTSRKTLMDTIGGEEHLPAGIGDAFTCKLISSQIHAWLIRTIEPTNPVLNEDSLIFGEEEDLWSGNGARLRLSSYAGNNPVTLAAANADIVREVVRGSFELTENGRLAVCRTLLNGRKLASVPGLETDSQSVLRDLINKTRGAFIANQLNLAEYILGT